MADVTRLEQFLNHIAHPEEPCPDPKTREEYILKEIAENKGGGGGSGALYVTITALPDPETQELSIITSDKTYAEIDAAMTAGTPVIAKMVAEGFFAPMLAQKMGTTIVFLMLGFAPMGQSSMLMAAVITMASDGTNGMNYTSVATMSPMGG